jgi:NitT/TauT family transport system substrate-binding protein
MNRRRFLAATALGATTGLLARQPTASAAESRLETTRVRLVKFPGVCIAPQYVAEPLLRAEGFTDVQYVELSGGVKDLYDALGSGAIDIMQWYLAPFIVAADKKAPIVFLAGVHVGCQEVVARERLRTIRDLKGKTVVAPFGGLNSVVAAMLAHVGLDYRTDVNFVEKSAAEGVQLLTDGKIDAFLATPPFAQELRAKKIGHVVMNMTTDRPWSQYFCCMVVANRDFVRKQPVAAKRAVRAILKADQLCAAEPERVARDIVDRGFTKSYEYALQSMKDIPYGRWRQYDPEDAVRFYALRLHEGKVIESTPQRIITEHSDWRILNELKKELKG